MPRWSGMEAVITPLRRAAGWINISHQFSRSIASLLHPLSRMGTVFSVSPTRAPVAQLDRASDFGSEGCRFKSCPVHHGFYWGFLRVFRVFFFDPKPHICILFALSAAYLRFPKSQRQRLPSPQFPKAHDLDRRFQAVENALNSQAVALLNLSNGNRRSETLP